MKYLVILLALLSLQGCAIETVNGKPVNDVLQEHFTPEAYNAIKDIPAEYGGAQAYAVVNVWSQLAAFFSGHGLGRKVIINAGILEDVEKTDPKAAEVWLIHEYLHHLDDFGRDGGVVWIDIEEFYAAYQAIQGTQQHGLLFYQVEKMQDHWVTNTFGLGEHSERIAYVGGLLIKQRATPELERVYRKVLRKYAQAP